MAQDCTHLDQITITEPATPVEGCEECLKTGGQWVHLRMCESCGKVGCCDSSPNRHATAHFRESSHPIGDLIVHGTHKSPLDFGRVTGLLRRFERRRTQPR